MIARWTSTEVVFPGSAVDGWVCVYRRSHVALQPIQDSNVAPPTPLPPLQRVLLASVLLSLYRAPAIPILAAHHSSGNMNPAATSYTIVHDDLVDAPTSQELRNALQKGSDEVKLETLRRIIVGTLNGQAHVSRQTNDLS